MIRAVLFDLDGTLLDRRETFRRHLELQVGRNPKLFSGGDPAGYVARLLELDENGKLDRTEFFMRAEAMFGLRAGAASMLQDDFEKHFPESCVAFPNVHETLGALKAAGLSLGLVTNGRVLIQGRKIDGLGIRHYFDVVVISEAAGFRKPDPRIFAHALDTLGVPASAAAYVGDNPDADVIGARQSGLTAVWKRDDFWPRPAEAHWMIEDLSELAAVIGPFTV